MSGAPNPQSLLLRKGWSKKAAAEIWGIAAFCSPSPFRGRRREVSLQVQQRSESLTVPSPCQGEGSGEGPKLATRSATLVDGLALFHECARAFLGVLRLHHLAREFVLDLESFLKRAPGASLDRALD